MAHNQTVADIKLLSIEKEEPKIPVFLAKYDHILDYSFVTFAHCTRFIYTLSYLLLIIIIQMDIIIIYALFLSIK